MHEMGIVTHLAKTLEEMAEENHITNYGSVTLEVGEVSGVMTELFTDFWDYYKQKHPVIKNCELKLETIHAVTFCSDCEKNYPTVKYGRTCPYCGSENTWLITGNETIIKEVEAETSDEQLQGTIKEEESSNLDTQQ
jgi:hydrogenase nickel incorporation protein HypA/HybF